MTAFEDLETFGLTQKAIKRFGGALERRGFVVAALEHQLGGGNARGEVDAVGGSGVGGFLRQDTAAAR